jgi:hypothetical protein|tara:strand:+ start:6704 stop:7279 length:576 start_codon:yes stop_codon:yes gene_type:complete
MEAILLYSSQLSMIGLLALMFNRVRTLYNESYPEESARINSILNRLIEGDIKLNDHYEIKMECLKQAQMFTGVQMLGIKRSNKDLNNNNMAWLHKAISLYLIGAVDYIGKHAQCGASTRKELIIFVLKSNLKLSNLVSSQYFEEALYRKLSSENDLMVRAGAKAAKSWSSDRNVPKNLTLSHQLNDWGVFA